MNKKEQTTPIMNYFSGVEVIDKSNFILSKSFNLCSIQTLEYLKACRGNFKISKEQHLSILGKQNYCIFSPRRCWVWESQNWRAYVSKRGTSFELKLGLTLKEACEAWADYYFKMTGIASNVICYY